MSTSALCLIYEDRAEVLRTYRNSFGTAIPIWEHMARTYLMMEYHKAGDKLWALSDQQHIPKALRAAFVMTFDHAYVPIDGVAEYAALLEEAGGLIPIQDGYANHWPAIAVDMRAISEQISKGSFSPGAFGIGLCCSSVVDLWRAWPRTKEREAVDALAYLNATSQ